MSTTKWNMSASKPHSATKEKKKDFQLALQPMPEIELIDPVTGKLPKNYKQILAGKDKKLQDANSQSASKEINEKDKFEFTLKPMPELALLDPFTGQLPGNYKEIVNGGSCNKRRSKDFDFQSLRTQSNDSTLSKVGHTHHRNIKIGPRKALFTNSKETTKLSSKNGLPRKITKTNPGVNESVLLDIEETEERLFLQKRKPKVSTIKFPKHHAAPVLKNTKIQRKRSASSNSSLEEFLKLEQQTKTPKGATAAKRSKDIDLAASIHEITNKLAENREMMNKIVTNDNQINRNLQEILGYLHKNNLKEDRLELDNAGKNASSTNEGEEYKENVSENLIPLQPSVKNNLLIATLKNNFEKKVLFDLEIESCDSPLRKKESGWQTPNTMLRSVSRRAKQQLLTLQDTPKTSM